MSWDHAKETSISVWNIQHIILLDEIISPKFYIFCTLRKIAENSLMQLMLIQFLPLN